MNHLSFFNHTGEKAQDQVLAWQRAVKILIVVSLGAES